METQGLSFSTGVGVQPYLAALEGLPLAAKMGCNYYYVDLNLETDLLSSWSREKTTAVKKATLELGVKPILHGNTQTPLASDEAEIISGAQRHLFAEIELATRLGAASLIIHGGIRLESDISEISRRRTMERFLRNLAPGIEQAAQSGIELWLENLPHYPKHQPFDTVCSRLVDFEIAHDQAPMLQYVLDVGHAHVNQWFAPEALKQFREQIRSICFSSNDGTRDSHSSVSANKIMTTEVLRAIADSEWRGIICFETEGSMPRDEISTLSKIWVDLS